MNNLIPAATLDAYQHHIRSIPRSRQAARLQGFKDGWHSAHAAGLRQLAQADLDAYGEYLHRNAAHLVGPGDGAYFAHQFPTLVNGFKDGWATALDAPK